MSSAPSLAPAATPGRGPMPEALLRALDVTIGRRLGGLLAGDYRSSFHGEGTELADYISFGASPRGPISLVQAGRALALVRGRDYVLAEDLRALAKDALRHRIILTYQALAEDVGVEAILDRVLAAVEVPRTDLSRATTAA